MKYKPGDKFIIEIERCNANGIPARYEIKNRKSTVAYSVSLSEITLDMLEPYNAEAEYQRGLADAWEAARKICGPVEKGGYTFEVIEKIFGTCSAFSIFQEKTADEVIAKIRAYEEEKKIKVGDEVKRNKNEISMLSMNENYVCIKYADETGLFTIANQYGNIFRVKRKDIVKTGRHFPEVAALLDKLKEDAPDV